MFVKLFTQPLVENLRKLIGYRGDIVEPPIVMPVTLINDGKELIVNSASAERTTAGTTTIFTAPSGRVDTFITSLTLAASGSQAAP